MQTMTPTKEDELLHWCQEKKVFNYIDVQNWNKEPHYYLRAERTVRDFVKEGKLRRISDTEAVLRGLRKAGRVALAWFEIV